MIYEQIFTSLNKENVNYLVVGGVALVLHGVVRFTADLDLMLSPETANLQKFLNVIKKLNYKPKLPQMPKELTFETLKEWKKKRNLEVLSFYKLDSPFEMIDVLVEPVVNFDEAYKRKKIVTINKVAIPLISISDLKKLKKDAGRPKDLEDIASLQKLEFLEEQNEK